MTTEKARSFAEEWINSWNDHDLEGILSHYVDNIEFHSPFIQLLKFNETGIITGKADLRKYFEIGLKSYPGLQFKLHDYFSGINTIVLCYLSVNGRLAAEVFELNEAGKAIKVYCNYSDSP